MADPDQVVHDASDVEARRAFLVRCGRFAAVTPPAIATLLTVSSIPQEAHASTIGRSHGSGAPPIIRIIGRIIGWFT